MKLIKIFFLVLVYCIVFVLPSVAQTDADAIMIPKSYFCGGVMYSNSNWSNYWEGTFKRNNGNIGTLNTNMYSVMVNYGVTSKLNVQVSLPYVTTEASGGTLAGQKGLQDISGTVKWMPVTIKRGRNALRLFGILTASTPISNYEPDFLPLSIGLHTSSLMFKGMVDYQRGHLFITGSGEYMRRSNISIDRTAYYTTEIHYTNQVAIPDGNDFGFRGGYRSSKWIAETVFYNSTTLGGFDIRKNDMPFPSNTMNMTTGGVNFKYTFTSPKGLELTSGADYVLAGRNVGQSTMIHGGVYYLVSISKKERKTK